MYLPHISNICIILSLFDADNKKNEADIDDFLIKAQFDAVVSKIETTAGSESSPLSNMFFRCFDIATFCTPKSSAILI
jgi:hypothetical protein